jgi:hypothetical protein
MTIEELNAKLDLLIDNLAKNNQDLYEALLVLAGDGDRALKVQAITDCRDGNCTRDPPGCHN